METMMEMLDRMFTPESGANLQAGKAALLRGVENARAQLTAFWEQQKKKR